MDLNFILGTIGTFIGDGGFKMTGTMVFSGWSYVVEFLLWIYFTDLSFLFGWVYSLSGEIVV